MNIDIEILYTILMSIAGGFLGTLWATWDKTQSAKTIEQFELNSPDTVVRQQLKIIANARQSILALDDGWREPHPYDADFDLSIIEAGSTGIHEGLMTREGEYMAYDEEAYYSRPLLVKWREPIRDIPLQDCREDSA